MRKKKIKEIIRTLFKITDYDRLAKIHAVAKTHLALQEKGGAV